MPKYYLPFEEYQRGWYVIEAENIEEARKIAEDGSFTDDHEQHYKDGETIWKPEEIEEMK